MLGFKCFLLDSGVDEFPPLSPAELEAALADVAALGALMIVHAEDAARHRARAGSRPGAAYADFLRSRPRDAETRAIRAACWTWPAGPAPGCTSLHLSSAGRAAR